MEHEKNTKQRILDVAIDLFSQRGYDGVSIRDITKVVGIKESSLYKHYGSKEAIMDAILCVAAARLSGSGLPDEQMEKLVETMSFEELFMLNWGAFKGFLNDPEVVRLRRIILMEQYRNSKVRDFFKAEMMVKPVADLEKVFAKMVKKGKIKKVDPHALAVAYFSFSIYMFLEHFAAGPDVIPDMEAMDRQVAAQNRLYSQMLKP